MRPHRAIWVIAGTAAALALIAFAARQVSGGPRANGADKFVRDRLVAEMIARLDRDHRARFASTRAVVEKVAAYCESPRLECAESWYARGLRKLYGDFDTQQAEAAFRKASELRPEWPWPVNGLGIAQFVTGNRDAALTSFDRALALDPKWSRPHSDLTILYRRAGDLKKALEQAELALKIEPEDLVNQFNYGVVLDDLGRHDEARALYQNVLAVAPDMAQAAYNLACSYGREGKAAEALPYLKRAIDADAAFREDALEDTDFDAIRGRHDFEAMVGLPGVPTVSGSQSDRW